MVDSGAGVDAGVEPDAGAEVDAGVETDAGVENDAGAEPNPDAGVAPDGGGSPDAGSSAQGVGGGCRCATPGAGGSWLLGVGFLAFFAVRRRRSGYFATGGFGAEQ